MLYLVFISVSTPPATPVCPEFVFAENPLAGIQFQEEGVLYIVASFPVLNEDYRFLTEECVRLHGVGPNESESDNT